MTRVLYPGSFDPVHNGHVELVETAAKLFDEVVVAAMRNPGKGEPFFTFDERHDMLIECFAHLENVRTTMFAELVVDLARREGVDFIVKGLRVVSDFESELQMAQTNALSPASRRSSCRPRRCTPTSRRSTSARSRASAATCPPWSPSRC